MRISSLRGSALLWSIGCAVLLSAPASAKTPDGLPPSVETVCSGLFGAARGLCNAFCEAQDCDVHPRPSCDQLRSNFAKQTGSSVFPCEQGTVATASPGSTAVATRTPISASPTP